MTTGSRSCLPDRFDFAFLPNSSVIDGSKNSCCRTSKKLLSVPAPVAADVLCDAVKRVA